MVQSYQTWNLRYNVRRLREADHNVPSGMLYQLANVYHVEECRKSYTIFSAYPEIPSLRSDICHNWNRSKEEKHSQ